MAPPPLAPETRAEVLEAALADLSTRWPITLITYPVGEPYPRLRGMGFINRGWVCYLSTKRKDRKVREIQENPRTSLLFVQQQRRKDHFIQIDAVAIEETGRAFDTWQEMRFEREGDNLRRATAGMTREDWIGWRFEPERLRIQGYLTGPWYETPVVYRRADLGLPPGDEPALPT